MRRIKCTRYVAVRDKREKFSFTRALNERKKVNQRIKLLSRNIENLII